MRQKVRRGCRALAHGAAWAVAATLLMGAGWPETFLAAPTVGGGEKDFAVVIGIEDYERLGAVTGAARNASGWHDFFVETLGVKANNVVLMRNDGFDRKILVAELKRAVQKLDRNGTLWVVLIGRGAAAMDGGVALLPAEAAAAAASPDALTTHQILALGGQTGAGNVRVISDLCLPGDQPGPPLAASQPKAGGARALLLEAGPCGPLGGLLPGAARPAVSYLTLGALRGWGDRNGDGIVNTHETIEYVWRLLNATLRPGDKAPAPLGDLKDQPLVLASGEKGPDPKIIEQEVANLLVAPPEMLLAVQAHFQQDGLRPEPGAVGGLYQQACASRYVPACRWERWVTDERGDLAKAAADLAPLCKVGDQLACLVGAWADTQRPAGVRSPKARDPKRGVATLERLCKAGYARGCAELAALVEVGVGTRPAPDRAASLYRQACQGADALGCGRLGALTLNPPDGWGLRRDVLRAIRHITLACDDGHLPSCTRLGGFLLAGDHVDRDPVAASKTLRKACLGGHLPGCRLLGTQYDDGVGVRTDDQRAVELFNQSCMRGDAGSCTHLAIHHLRGKVLPLDPRRAAELYGKACGGGDAEGCHGLGDMLAEGRSMRRDPGKAAKVLDQACRGGSMRGCVRLGQLLEDGATGRKDARSAASLYDRACKGGEASGCEHLARLQAAGEGTRKDPRAAVKRLEGLCEDGHGSACLQLGQILKEGQGVRKDPSRARGLFRKACRMGEVKACMMR